MPLLMVGRLSVGNCELPELQALISSVCCRFFTYSLQNLTFPGPTVLPDIHPLTAVYYAQLELSNIINNFDWFLLEELYENASNKQSYPRKNIN